MTESQTEEREHVTGAVRELREYARGVMDVDHQDVHPSAGLIEDVETREALSFFAEAYNPSAEDIERGMPRDFWETPIAQRAIRKHATNVATQAIKEGNASQASYLTGLPGYDPDVSGLHAVQQLAEWLTESEACKLIYIAALMGRGKTDMSLLFGEIIADHYRRVRRVVDSDVEVPDPEFAANFFVDTPDDAPDVQQINHYDRLVEWMEQGSSADNRWFIFDEASSELTAQNAANAQKVVKRMGGLVKKMRKAGVNMIVIGHDAGDVHVAIRSLADYVSKPSQKKARFYSGVTKREGEGHLFDISGIPPTSWSFDTDDTADWCWCDDEAENCPYSDAIDEFEGFTQQEMKREIEERGARLWQQTDVTQKEVAQALSTETVSVSTAGISRAADRINA